MIDKLIPMVDFVLEHPASTDYEWQLRNHLNYANFLKRPLTLGMFVTGLGEALFTGWSVYEDDSQLWLTDGKNTLQVYVINNTLIECSDGMFYYNTIEDFDYIRPTLTESAKKQIY